MLYVAATPIGNLGDMTARLIDLMKSVDFVICEDTRESRKLFAVSGIPQKPMVSYYAPAEEEKIPAIMERLVKGDDGLLLTDNGTPCISDPGYRLVDECFIKGIRVVPVPGPSALTAALSVCGFSADAFYFYGFPPRRGGKLVKALEEMKIINGLIVLYESPYRIRDTLEAIAKVFPSQQVFMGRELTKVHEQLLRGRAEEILAGLKAEIKGEIVIVISHYLEKKVKKKYNKYRNDDDDRIDDDVE